MDTFEIGAGLTIEKHPQGATLNYFAAEDKEVDVFHVGLSVRSLKACHKALTRTVASWQTKDGSFWISKRDGQVSLSFKMQGPPYESREVVLNAEELSRLEAAVARLASESV